MTTIQMRQQVAAAYPSQTWKLKVQRMTTDQLIAIYYRFLKENKFVTEKPITIKEPEARFHQMTLCECGLKKGD